MLVQTIHNFASIDLPFGGHLAQLLRFEAIEALGELFRFQVDILFNTDSSVGLSIGDYLGKTATITISQGDEPARYFHGMICESEFIDQAKNEGRWLHYVRLIMVPKLFIFAQNKEYRLFEEKTVKEIITSVLSASGVAFEDKLSGTFEKRGYTTQFGESDFAFISRLMEEEGIYYYFQHDKDKHTLVLCNAPTSHPEGTPATLEYNASSRGLNIGDRAEGDNFVHTWAQKVSAHALQNYVLWDNLFSLPNSHIEANSVFLDKDNDTTKFFRAVDTYDFQGTYELHQPSGGADEPAANNKHISSAPARATIRRQILEARRKIYTGVAITPLLACGHKFTLAEKPSYGDISEFMLLRVRTVVYGPAYQSTDASSDRWPDDAVTQIEAIPASYVWRSQPVTPKPIAHGPQTAVVVGPAGETIFTDKYGRVKVQFPWDRYGKNDPHSSAWLRVSQTGGIGNTILPRVGHEVLVGFLDGNPDRPIVIGRLFSENNMPLYKLPDHKTRAVWRTQTYPHVASLKSPFKDVEDKDAVGNELRFEDKADNQEVYLLANKDMKTRIFNDETHHVGHDQNTTILNDSVREVKNNSKVTIDKDSNVTIGQHSTIETKGNEKRDVKGTSTVEIVGNHKVTMKADADYTTSGKNTVKIDGDDKQDYGGKSNVKVSGALTIESGEKILLKVGGNSIEISQSGIKINGMMVKIEGSATAELSSALTTVKASGILTAQGSLVKIN